MVLQVTDVATYMEDTAYDCVSKFLNGFPVNVNGQKTYPVLFAYVDKDKQLKIMPEAPPAESVDLEMLTIATRRTD